MVLVERGCLPFFVERENRNKWKTRTVDNVPSLPSVLSSLFVRLVCTLERATCVGGGGVEDEGKGLLVSGWGAGVEERATCEGGWGTGAEERTTCVRG